jgi:hypothetical protein
MIILWHVDPLLGNRFITRNNGVTGKWYSLRGPCDIYVKQQQKNCWERCFPCRPCRGILSRTSQQQSPASKDLNTETEEATVLEDVTRQQLVKIQQTEKSSYVP